MKHFPHRIAIIGGGAGGASAAKILHDQGVKNVTIYEATDTIGGKSHTLTQGNSLIELGTCYSTLAHYITNGWMKSLGIPMMSVGEQRYDGTDFIKYVKTGKGRPLPLQMVRFWRDYTKLLKALEAANPGQSVLDEAAQPIQTWLQNRKLPMIEKFMHRGLTAMGYGFLDETPTIQAIRWCNIQLIMTGARDKLSVPACGWTKFWQLLTAGIDIKTNTPVLFVDRSNNDVTITTSSGSKKYDALIVAIPPDEFVNICRPSESEAQIANAISWQKYSVALFAANNWFTNWRTEGYSHASIPGAKHGQIIAARTEDYDLEVGGQLYLTGQIPGAYTDRELADILKHEVSVKGGAITNLIMQKTWKYFPRYKQEAIRTGLLQAMRDMQGDNRTWYTGAAFSHEAVSNIVNFNVDLVRDMQAHLASHPIDELV